MSAWESTFIVEADVFSDTSVSDVMWFLLCFRW